MHPSDIDQLHEILIRLIAATLMGGVLGVNRDLHRKPAGLRVLAMVSLGSCAVIMLSISAASTVTTIPSDGISRTVQGILAGIGFLGAGVIMRLQGKDEVHGITTASSIWISAILGMICAMGQWLLGLSTFCIAWIVLVFGTWLELRIVSSVATKPVNSALETTELQDSPGLRDK